MGGVGGDRILKVRFKLIKKQQFQASFLTVNFSLYQCLTENLLCYFNEYYTRIQNYMVRLHLALSFTQEGYWNWIISVYSLVICKFKGHCYVYTSTWLYCVFLELIWSVVLLMYFGNGVIDLRTVRFLHIFAFVLWNIYLYFIFIWYIVFLTFFVFNTSLQSLVMILSAFLVQCI